MLPQTAILASLKANSVACIKQLGRVRDFRFPSTHGDLLGTIRALEQLIVVVSCSAFHYATHAKLQQANKGARLSFTEVS